MSRYGRLRSPSTSRSIPCPGTVGSSTKPSRTVSGATAIASHAGFRFTKHSAIQKFGITAETATVAARPTNVEL